jgi:hypothetical protein
VIALASLVPLPLSIVRSALHNETDVRAALKIYDAQRRELFSALNASGGLAAVLAKAPELAMPFDAWLDAVNGSAH